MHTDCTVEQDGLLHSWVRTHARTHARTHTHTHTHTLNNPFARTIQVSRYQKGKTNLDFTEARESEWQWHQLGHMQVCTSLQTDNHASTPPLNFLQAGCPSCCPTNSIKALKAHTLTHTDRQGINTMPPAAYRMGGKRHNKTAERR